MKLRIRVWHADSLHAVQERIVEFMPADGRRLIAFTHIEMPMPGRSSVRFAAEVLDEPEESSPEGT